MPNCCSVYCSHTAVQKVACKYKVQEVLKIFNDLLILEQSSIRDELETSYGTLVLAATIKRTLVDAGMHEHTAWRSEDLSLAESTEGEDYNLLFST